MNHFRVTYLTIAEAEEELAINCEGSNSAFDDSSFLETPASLATSHSVDHFVNYYISKFSQNQDDSICHKLSKRDNRYPAYSIVKTYTKLGSDGISN